MHFLPECLENNKSTTVFSYLILGIIIFFIMERFLHWRHCHEEGDLIPELHKENDLKRSMAAFSAFLLGIVFMALANKFLPS